MSTTPVIFDDGSRALVPQANLSAALKDGGKIAQPMQFDDGSRAYVPLEKVHDAVHDGGMLIGMPPQPPQVTPEPEIVSQALGSAVKRGAAETARDVYDVSAPAIATQIWRKLNGQPNQIDKLPPKMIQMFLMAGGVPESEISGVKAAKIAEAGKTTPDLPDLEGVPSPQTEGAGGYSEVEPPAEPVAPKVDTSPKRVGELLNEATGGQGIVRGVSMRNQPGARVTAAQSPEIPVGATMRAIQESLPASQVPKFAPTADVNAAIRASQLPKGFTPVDSSVLAGYKYDPATREFESITNTGQHYVHGDVSPEEAEAFEQAASKGKAWNQLRSQNVQVAKVVNGKRMATKPITHGEIPEGVEPPPGGMMRAIQESAKKPSPQEDLTPALTEMLKRARQGKKLADLQ